jgi:ligand-binding sensor domain-containing protein/two-component sensor histidine kinase
VRGKWVFIFLVLWAVQLNAQQPQVRFNALTVDEGLSHYNVRNIAQDKYGYIWITTADGLNRYDGYEFKVWRYSVSDTFSLSNNDLLGLAIDQDGIIWVGSHFGLNKFDPVTGKSERYYFNEKDNKSISNNHIRSVFVDSKNQVWIGTEEGINRYNRSQNNFYRILDDRAFTDDFGRSNLSYNRVNSFYETRDGTLWICLDGAGYKKLQSASDNSFKHYLLPQPNDTSSTHLIDIVRVLYESKDGHLWFGTDYGLTEHDPIANTFTTHHHSGHQKDSLSYNYVWNIYEDERGKIWASTYGGGINIYDRATSIFHHLKQSSGLNSTFIWPLFVDRNKTIWTGSEQEEGGVYFYTPHSHKFELHLPQKTIEQPYFSSIFELNEYSVLGASGNALYTYNLKKERLIKVHQTTEEIMSIYPTENGFQVLTWRTQLLLNRQFELQTEEEFKLDYPTVVIQGEDGFYWKGTKTKGLWKYNSNRVAVDSFLTEGNSNLYQDSRYITALLEDGSYMWIGALRNGLFRLDKATGKLKEFPLHENGLQEVSVLTIIKGLANEIWLGTDDHGILKFNTSNGSYELINTDNGLQNNHISGLVLDRENKQLWITSNEGLEQYNLITKSIRNYTLEDGLQHTQFEGIKYRGPSGNIYLSGMGGLNVFHPSQIQFNPNGPQILVNRLLVNDADLKSNQPLDLNQLVELELKYNENDLALEIACTNFIHASKNKYSWRLKGYSDRWSTPTTNRNITYTNLSPGTYTLEIKAQNNDGVWGEVKSIQIVVYPPFWQTWWFRILVVLVLAIIVYSIYRYRIYQIKKVEQLRLKIASNLHDDVGSLLTMITVQTDLMEQDIYSEEEQKEEVKNIASNSREAAKTMSDIVWSIDSRKDKMEDVLDRMKDFANAMLSPKGIAFNFECDQLKQQESLPIDFRQNCYLVFKEAINNVVKHSDATMVNITIKKQGKNFNMRIKDNGATTENGRLPGQGLMNMKMRAEAIGGTVEIKTNNGFEVLMKVRI